MNFGEYVRLGFAHVIPSGADHILFILAVLFMSSDLKGILIQASIFTLAHSLTLFLSAYDFVRINPSLTEPLIALSIVVSALQNLLNSETGRFRFLMIFGFGLLHGLGFAAALDETGIAGTLKLAGILGFNIGVEIAQIAIILLLFYGGVVHIRNYEWYKTKLVPAVSVLIAISGSFIFIGRLIS